MRSQKAMTLTLEVIDNFRSSLSAKGKSQQTVKAYSTDLRMLLLEMETESVDYEDFEDTALAWLTAGKGILAPKTTQRRLTSVKAFVKWADWPISFDDYIAPTPLKGQPHPVPEGIAGVKRMIEVARTEQQAALVALCGLCGLRVAEALSVRPSHFDLDEMTLTIHGKGAKQRVVPVSTYAWKVLQTPVTRAWTKGDIPVIGLKDRFARATITRLGVKARLRRHVASHDLRATFATEVYNKTLDQRLVQELLGHSSGATTEIYIERNKEQLRNGVEL